VKVPTFYFVAYEEESGNVVEIGDPVTDFRGARGVLRSLTAARVPGKSGKVAVELMSDGDDDGATVYHYDKVWGLRVEAEPDPNA
jgi:hypothetical protein